MRNLKKPATTTRRTNAWGVDLHYEDAFGKWHDASDATVQAVLEAMGADESHEAPPQDCPVVFSRAGHGSHLKQGGVVKLESGEQIEVSNRLSPDLPLGYHWLQHRNASQPVRLIVSPTKCYLPDDLQTWGWAVQLYASRSRQSWGIGDFSDLAQLAEWSGGKSGAGMMLVNPLSAATPVSPQQTSPYYPTSRRFFNPLFIHVEWVPGAREGDSAEMQALAKAGRELNSIRLIDRDKVFALKMRALEVLWSRFTADDSFDTFCREQGADLHRFALFCALAEHHNSGWRSWPERHRHPANRQVEGFAHENSSRVEFHKWLQWIIDRQLARSAKHLALTQDLPIGVDPDGADAWAWPDVLADGAAVGAPPDEFNTQGQNWGLPPFVPHKLRAAAYEPFIQTIRAAFRNGGGLRIDHVMGLFRLFWIPQGMPAKHGTYVRYNADEMLAIVALESQRAKAFVIGEDLGTVEDEAREKLARHGVMSYRLLWFEKKAPKTYPREALAAITTHDLPTVAGLWTGSDLAKQHELGLSPNEESTAEIHQRLKRVAGLTESMPVDEVIARSYSVLGRAPSRILTAALDDAAAVAERPNMPATMSDKHPNWSIALPVPIEDLMQAELPRRIAAALQRANQQTRQFGNSGQ
ncbi:MAG: 4-alpha-glucanotransferase [Acidobacteriota bacterium]|nr:4-alpha-glucanotransferase [Acidobacteriota bacterium]